MGLLEAMTSSEPLEITGSELVHLLGSQRDQSPSAGCVLLDCRPFLDFSLTHIYESRNVNWNSMLRRRSKSSVVALEWLIPDKSLLGRLRRAEVSAVVVLDEGSGCVAELKAESVGKMLLSALHNESQSQICFLQGNPRPKAFLRTSVVLWRNETFNDVPELIPSCLLLILAYSCYCVNLLVQFC